jgi:hypothetical protein
MTAIRYVAGSAMSIALACAPGLTAQTGTYFTGPSPINELNLAGSNSFSPTLTEDELYLVFASDRPGGQGSYDLYETRRPNVDAPWAPPQPLPLLNSSGADYEPNISYDGLEMYFISTRPGGIGASDIYVTRRPATNAPWGPPQNIGPPLNGPGIANDDPYLTQDGLSMYFTSGGAGGADVYTATRPAIGAPWGNKQPVAAANSAQFDHSPLPEGNNGEVLWFSSTRPGGGGSSDFWMTSRDPVTGLYDPPILIPDINSTDWDSNAWSSGVTGRLYVSRVVGGFSQLWIVCRRITIVWIYECVISFWVRVGIQWFPPPPRWIWQRVWIVRLVGVVIRIRWYRWFRWPLGGISALLISPVIQNPPIPAFTVLPGGEGGIMLNPAFAMTQTLSIVLPGNSAGLEGVDLPVPPDPSLAGFELHMQNAGLEFGTNVLTISELGTVRLTN